MPIDARLYTPSMTRAPSLSEDVGVSHKVSLVRVGEHSGATWVAELDGSASVTARGATPEEAVRRALASVEADLEPERADPPGDGPKAQVAARHSGKLLVRMPATLHDELARAAQLEGVSLNQLITGVLASAVEWRADVRSPRAVGDEAEGAPSRLTRIAIVANLAVVTLVALVALVLLVTAWRDGI